MSTPSPTVLPTIEPIGIADGRIRAVIEHITPAVDDGRFPIKRICGDTVEVEADCFADGHDAMACAVLYRPVGAGAWRRTPMRALGNDRWSGSFTVDTLGCWEYAVQAWVDPLLSWQHDFVRRVDLADICIAAHSGVALIQEAAQRAEPTAQAHLLRTWASDLSALLAQSTQASGCDVAA